MKVYISADMEGISGIVHSNQTDSSNPEYPSARKLMVAEVNAAVEGALAGGATEVVVNDSHGSMRNLPVEDIHPDAILLSGSPKIGSMMAGIDSSFSAVFFVGYHARAGSLLANLDHTYYGPNNVQNVWLNGIEVGEYGINGGFAGYYGVPVALMTGDQTACAQAKQLLGDDLETVVVKEAVGRVAAKNLHPTRVHSMIRNAAQKALQKKRSPFVFSSPITLRLALPRSSQADRCTLMPEVKRIAPRMVEFTHPDYAVLFNAFYALLILADIQV